MEIIKAIDFKACVPVAITQSVIKMMPDAIVVGRCKDCKYYSSGVLLADNGNCFNGVDIRGNGTPRDFGCALWEAKEESCD